MPSIDPKRLIQLRELKGLSRQALHAASNVSVRTIARIESNEGLYGIREVNLHRFAKALDLPPDVVAGDAPLPDGLAEDSSGSVVHPHVLRALREQKGMTPAELAEESGVAERLIGRLESSTKTIESIQAEALAKALGTDRQKLSETVASAPYQPNTDTEPVRAAVGMSPQLRLAYDLITHRYGPTRAQIIELAPLLFALVAESCLAKRRRELEEVEQSANRLRELGSAGSHLYFTPYLVDVEYGAALEAASIEAADLLGDTVREDDWAWQNFTGDDLNEVTPFADYLCKLAEELNVGGIVDFFPTEPEATVGIDTIWGAEPYQVCRNTLMELVGGSKHARWALAYGDAQLSRMPRHLLHPDAKEARVEWLEGRLTDEVRDAREKWEALLEAVSLEILFDRDPPVRDERPNAPRGESP